MYRQLHIECFGFVTARGSIMLEVRTNGESSFVLGPFENKQQRLIMAEDLKRTGKKLAAEIAAKRIPRPVVLPPPVRLECMREMATA
jgi:hypothetical protein